MDDDEASLGSLLGAGGTGPGGMGPGRGGVGGRPVPPGNGGRMMPNEAEESEEGPLPGLGDGAVPGSGGKTGKGSPPGRMITGTPPAEVLEWDATLPAEVPGTGTGTGKGGMIGRGRIRIGLGGVDVCDCDVTECAEFDALPQVPRHSQRGLIVFVA